MRIKFPLYLLIAVTWSSIGAGANQADDPVKKLGAFLGKWKSAATFAGGATATANLECRWSALSDYLICEQAVTMGANESRQLTIYSYNRKDGNYSYVTISNPGAKPTSGAVTINGNVWTYLSSYEANGKTVQVRNTNEFTDARTEIFKVVTSDDGGATWKPLLEGAAQKVGD